jgi:hypothetical protein
MPGSSYDDSVPASGLNVLTAHIDATVVTETTVEADTLHAFDVVGRAGLQLSGKQHSSAAMRDS